MTKKKTLESQSTNKTYSLLGIFSGIKVNTVPPPTAPKYKLHPSILLHGILTFHVAPK